MQLTRDVATCLFYTGIDPFTKRPVQVAKKIHLPLRDATRADAVLQTGQLLRGPRSRPFKPAGAI
jgi:hypothetical protein